MQTTPRRIALCSSLALACGPASPADPNTTTGTNTPSSSEASSDPTSSSSSSSSSSSTSSSTAETTTPTSTTGPAETTTSATTGCVPDDGVSRCEPQPQLKLTTFSFDGMGPVPDQDLDFVQACTVTSSALEAQDVVLTLACQDADNQAVAHELRATLDPPAAAPPVAAGDPVTLRVRTIGAIDTGSATIVAVVDAAQQPVLAYSSGGLQHAALLAPLELATAETCPAECATQCDFIFDPCPCTIRLGVDFTLAGETVRVVDGNAGVLAGPPRLELRVPHARRLEGSPSNPGDCDFLSSSVTVLVLRTP